MNIKGKYEKYDENCKKVLKSYQKNCKSGKNLKKRWKKVLRKFQEMVIVVRNCKNYERNLSDMVKMVEKIQGMLWENG